MAAKSSPVRRSGDRRIPGNECVLRRWGNYDLIWVALTGQLRVLNELWKLSCLERAVGIKRKISHLPRPICINQPVELGCIHWNVYKMQLVHLIGASLGSFWAPAQPDFLRSMLLRLMHAKWGQLETSIQWVSGNLPRSRKSSAFWRKRHPCLKVHPRHLSPQPCGFPIWTIHVARHVQEHIVDENESDGARVDES